MSRFFFILFSTIIFSTNAFSQGASTTEFGISDRLGLLPSVRAGMNLFSRASSVDKHGIIEPKNKAQFSGGFGADYFFGKYLGTFTQVDFNQRTNNYLGLVRASASYVDVPFGIALNAGEFLWFGSSRTTTRAGSYMALPMTDFECDNKESTKLIFGGDKNLFPFLTSQTYAGLYFEEEVLFAIARNLNFGLSAWAKLPLGSAVKEIRSNFYEAGLGLKVGFF